MKLTDLPPDHATAWEAQLALVFERRETATRLVERRHRGPLRVQKALYPEGEKVCQAILLHPPAGIAAGDHLHIQAKVRAGAHAQLTTPGAGKWYGQGLSFVPAEHRPGDAAFHPKASQTLEFDIAAGGILEWLPQESIVFDGADAGMTTRVRLAADAIFIGREILCLGRAAAGERFTHGRLRLETCIERDSRPIWLERGQLSGSDPMLASPAGWAGASVCGTGLAAAPIAPDLLAACRSIAPADGALHGVTALPGLLVARYLGHSSEAAAQWLTRLWEMLRPALIGRPAVIPRIWNT